jgi:hypothetical protein
MVFQLLQSFKNSAVDCICCWILSSLKKRKYRQSFVQKARGDLNELCDQYFQDRGQN